jgi:CheY-like chemotaxis protein
MDKSNIKLLLVEDNMLAQMAQKMSLEQAGCQVDIAATGEQAIQLSMENHYNLILMDIGLGDEDGFTVTREIKNKSVKNKDTLVVALTAHSIEDYGKKAEECGMQGFLTKPLTPETIKELLTNFLSK